VFYLMTTIGRMQAQYGTLKSPSDCVGQVRKYASSLARMIRNRIESKGRCGLLVVRGQRCWVGGWGWVFGVVIELLCF